MPGTNILVLVGLLFYLVASLLLWRILLEDPAPMGSRRSRRRRRLRLAKAFATLVGGGAAGAASLLLIVIVVDAAWPGTMSTAGMFAVWVVASVAAMLFIGRPSLIRRIVTRAGLTVGMQGVILPLATLVSFIVAGMRLAGSAGTGAERAVEVLGVRLVGNLPAVWIGLGGFGIGLVLVIVADRARRRVDQRPSRRRARASRAAIISARARPRS